MQSLTSHAALNSTTLRTLKRCELGSLSLANCRGVSDEWLIALSSSSLSSGSPNRKSLANCDGQRLRSASTASNDWNKTNNASSFNRGGYNMSEPSSPPPLRDIHPTQFVVPSNHSSSFLDVASSSSMMMDLDDYDDLNSGGDSLRNLQPLPLLPQAHQEQEDDDQDPDSMEDCCAKSNESRSTSSFVSASSRPASPLLPSVLPPPEFFSLKWSSPASSSSLWLHPMRGSGMTDAHDNDMLTLPLSPQKRSPLPTGNGNGADPNALYTDKRSFNDETSYNDSNKDTASTLTLLDLSGSQRLTDRGLLQLSNTPLRFLEVARLDNCHGITGRGMLAFSHSRRLHTLSLANCRRLTDEAVVNVSHLGTSLMALNLGGCRCLTDRSLEALSGLVELRKLDLSQVRYRLNLLALLEGNGVRAFSHFSSGSSKNKLQSISATSLQMMASSVLMTSAVWRNCL